MHIRANSGSHRNVWPGTGTCCAWGARSFSNAHCSSQSLQSILLSYQVLLTLGGVYNKQNYDWSETWECKALARRESSPPSSTVISHKNERNLDNFKNFYTEEMWNVWRCYAQSQTEGSYHSTGLTAMDKKAASEHNGYLTSDNTMNCCKLSMCMTANYDTKRLDFTTATISLLAAQQTDTHSSLCLHIFSLQ